jgi:ribosomal protein S27E
MRGRYGVDRFSNCLMWWAFAIILLNVFVGSGILNLLGLAVFIFAYYRVFSKNYTKRSAENTWYLNKTYRLRMKMSKLKGRFGILKTHHIYKCPGCRQKVKVPRGRGKIAITCPKCGREFIKRS